MITKIFSRHNLDQLNIIIIKFSLRLRSLSSCAKRDRRFLYCSLFLLCSLFCNARVAREDPRDYLSQCLPSLPGIFKLSACFWNEMTMRHDLEMHRYVEYPVQSRNSNRCTCWCTSLARFFTYVRSSQTCHLRRTCEFPSISACSDEIDILSHELKETVINGER